MYQSILVGGLLPLLGHGSGLLAGKCVDTVEEGNGGEGELGHLGEDAPALTLGGLGAGAVGTEGNVVSYIREAMDVSTNGQLQKTILVNSRGRAFQGI
jgi:hypothetical protein